MWRCYGLLSLRTLHCPKDRYCDVTMIWPLLFRRICADVSETPDNALTTRMHGDYRLSIDKFFVGLNAICYTFLRNNLIYIEGRNCRLSTVPRLFNKCSGLRPSDILLMTCLPWPAWWPLYLHVNTRDCKDGQQYAKDCFVPTILGVS